LPNVEDFGTIGPVVTLNLTACLVFLTVAISGAMIVWRKLRDAGEAAAGELVCVRCRTPARLLSPDSFVCPGCHQDVRQLGIALDRPKRLTRPFWHVLIFSAALCAVAMVTTGELSSRLRVRYVSIQSNMQFAGEAYQNVDFVLTGWRHSDGPLHGELYADMFLKNGQAVTLVIDSPSRRYRLIDIKGHEWPSQESIGQEGALRWLSMAGLDTANPEVRQQEASWMSARIEDLLSGNDRSPFGPWDRRPRYMGGGGGSSGGSGDPEMLMPSLVIGWSLIWLAGLTLIVRPRATARSAQKEATA
jgi:hypothetical protein